jgi:hypothetical protein
MYCKNCGNQINQDAIACLKCGCDPSKGNKFCNSCGVNTNPEQIICIECGVTLSKKSSEEGKTVAIISYLTLIGFIIAIIKHKDNKTKIGAYHLRQAVGLLLTNIIFCFGIWILCIPMFSMRSYSNVASYAVFIGIISFFAGILLTICYIASIINAVKGIEKPAPIFGKFYEILFTNMFDENENGVWYEPKDSRIIMLLKIYDFVRKNIKKIIISIILFYVFLFILVLLKNL